MTWNTIKHHCNLHTIRDFSVHVLTPSVPTHVEQTPYEEYLHGILLNRFTI